MKKQLVFFTVVVLSLFLLAACDQTPGYALSFQNNTNNIAGSGNITLYSVSGAVEEDYGAGVVIPVGSLYSLNGETAGTLEFEVGFNGTVYRNTTIITLAVGGTYQLRFTQNAGLPGTLSCNLFQTDSNQPIDLDPIL